MVNLAHQCFIPRTAAAVRAHVGFVQILPEDLVVVVYSQLSDLIHVTGVDLQEWVEELELVVAATTVDAVALALLVL